MVLIVGEIDDERVGSLVGSAAEALAQAGVEVTVRRAPARGLPATATEYDKAPSFVETPGPLVESWRFARHVEALTAPGDHVMIADFHGLGGVAALENVARDARSARSIWTLAGAGHVLELIEASGSCIGMSEDEDSTVDWELTQYRWSDHVVALAESARLAVEELGVDVGLVPPRPVAVIHRPAWDRSSIFLPEPVSRRDAGPAILRALADVLDARPNVRLYVADDPVEDRYWSGTTLEWAVDVLMPWSDRVVIGRGPVPDDALIVLGDPFGVPSDDVVRRYRAGAVVLARAGSLAAAMLPAARVWREAQDLPAAIGDPGARRGAPSDPDGITVPASTIVAAPDRASRVSVGIPVYRDVRFLDECVESILAQDQPPHEILLVDDGSRSAQVDAALERWRRARPDLVRVLRQPNRGVSEARNRMIAEMTGDAFVLVDQDDLLDRGFISRAASLLRRRPDVWAAAVWTEFFGAYEGVEAKPPFDRRTGSRENTIISTGALIDMAVRDRGIRFAPDLSFIYCEDWHFWSQIVAAGGRIGLVPEVLARHRVHPRSGGHRRTEFAHRVGRSRAVAPMRGDDCP